MIGSSYIGGRGVGAYARKIPSVGAGCKTENGFSSIQIWRSLEQLRQSANLWFSNQETVRAEVIFRTLLKLNCAVASENNRVPASRGCFEVSKLPNYSNTIRDPMIQIVEPRRWFDCVKRAVKITPRIKRV